METPSLDVSVVAFQGEAMLVSWNESSNRGRTVTFMLEDESPIHPFKSFNVREGKSKTAGKRFMLLAVEIGDDEKPVSAIREKKDSGKPYGKQASILHAKGWFFHVPVLNAIGTYEEYTEHVAHAHCALCGKKANEENQVLPMRFGPHGDWGSHLLPICDLCENDAREAEPEKMAARAARYTVDWASAKLANTLGLQSMGHVPPEILQDWCKQNGISKTLPDTYLYGSRK